MKDNEKKINFGFAEMSQWQPVQPNEIRTRGKEYISWGENNMFPTYLYNLYLNCSTHQSIIDGIAEYTFGNGINKAPGVPDIVNEETQQTTEEFVQKVISDYVLFGGFNIQVIQSRGGNKSQYIWTDTQRIRYDEEVTKVFYSKEWGKNGTKAVEYPIWDGKQKDSFFVFRGNKTRGIYPIQSYIGALTAIETQTEIQNFHINSIKNNFNVSAVINFNNGQPSEEIMKDIEKGVQEKFCGSNNAAKFFLTFNDNKESAVTIERLESDNFDEKFGQLSKDTIQNIYASNRIVSPCLFGFVQENQGFSATEFTESFEVFNNTVIKNIQITLQKQFDKLFGIENSITFNKFQINPVV